MQVRCPHCHQPSDLADESQLSDILCESCGSNFSLVSDLTATYRSVSAKTIGRFDLVQQVGVGAFGTVWKALDKDLDRTVAVKIPRRGELSPAETEQFLREARAAAQLKHPSIVSVHEVGRDGDTVYIVSDFVQGLTLADWLTGQKLTAREAAELCAEVAEALEHAHRTGVVHRDLKPSNIMLDAEGQPHIMDFGLAKRQKGEVTMTMDGQVLGTPAYMSPEQAKGESHDVDGRTDVYSLGVILYELLTGELPFRGNRNMLLHQVLNDEPRAPRKLNDTIPRDLETIALRAMAKEPGRRYPTAREMADDLRRYVRGEPIHARPVSSVERLWRWAKRAPGTATLSAAVLVLLLTVAAVASAGYIRTRSLYIAADDERQKADQERQKADQSRKQSDEARKTSDSLRKQAVTDRDAARKAQKEEADSRHRIEQMLYVQRMRRACQGWESQNLPDDVWPLVQSMKPAKDQPDPRGWEWYYLDRKVKSNFDAALVSDEVKPPPAVLSLAWNPDGSRVAGAGEDGVVRVWDVAAKKVVLRLAPGEKEARPPVRCVLWSPDGSRIAAVGDDYVVRVWQAASGDKQFELQEAKKLAPKIAGQDSPRLSWSVDGTRLATASSGQSVVVVWDTASGKAVLESKRAGTTYNYYSGRRTPIAIHPDGDWIVTSGHGGDGLKVISLKSGSPVDTSKMSLNVWNTLDMQWSPDGRFLATLSPNDLAIWDRPASRRVMGIGGSFNARSLCWNPRGDLIATVGQDGFARVTDVRKLYAPPDPRNPNQEIYGVTDVPEWRKVTNLANEVAFSRDGRLAAACGDGSIKVWSLAARDEQSTQLAIDQQRGGPMRVWGIDWSRDGTRLAVVLSDDLVKLFDVQSGAQVRAMRRRGAVLRVVAISPDGKRVAGMGSAPGDTVWTTWDVASGRELTTVLQREVASGLLERLRNLVGDRPVTAAPLHMAWSFDGVYLATAHADGGIRIWNSESGRLAHTIKAHQAGVNGLAWSPKDLRLVSVGEDALVHVWDGGSGAPIHTLTGHAGPLRSATWSPDAAQIATVGDDGNGRIWDAADGRLINRLSSSSRGSSQKSMVRWSPDGKRIVTVGLGYITVWDALGGEDMLTLASSRDLNTMYGSYYDSVSTIAWSPDGTQLASNHGEAIKIWDTDRVIRVPRTPPYDSLILPGDLVASGSVWRFLHDGSDQKTAWRDPDYNDGKWLAGPAQLGYGDGDEATDVALAANPQADATGVFRPAPTAPPAAAPKKRPITTYFRRTFQIASTSNIKDVVLGLVRDDGAAVHLNGRELVRDNLPPDARYDQYASRTIDQADESRMVYYSVPPGLLRSGRNVLAVEVHQCNSTSSDISFDLQLSSNALERVLETLRSGGRSQQVDAALVLAEGLKGLDTSPAVPQLVELLKDPSTAVQRPVIKALGAIGHDADRVAPALASVLEKALAESDEVTAREAVIALWKLGRTTEHSVPLVSKLFTAEKDETKQLACRLLDQVGYDAKAAVPALEKLLAEASAPVRGVAAATLLRVDRDRIDRPLPLPPTKSTAERDARWQAARSIAEAAWPLVWQADRPKADYEEGLRLARIAATLHADSRTMLNPLGAALCRLDKYQEALAPLEKSYARNKRSARSDLYDLAFLAIAHQKLGQSDKARVYLDELHTLMQNKSYASSEAHQTLAAEADALLGVASPPAAEAAPPAVTAPKAEDPPAEARHDEPPK